MKSGILAIYTTVAAICILAPATVFGISMGIDAGFHYNQAPGFAVGMIYTHDVTDWFEAGIDGMYWTQLTEDETDSWEKNNPDDMTGTVHKFRDLRQAQAGFFGPVVAFPLTKRKDRFYLATPTLGFGVEAYAHRTWTEETIDRPAADDEVIEDNPTLDSGFSWYVRPGFTFSLFFWRISYQHYFTREGAVQFQITTGLDIYRIFTKEGKKNYDPYKKYNPNPVY